VVRPDGLQVRRSKRRFQWICRRASSLRSTPEAGTDELDALGHCAGRRSDDFHIGGQYDGWAPSEQVRHLGVDVTVNVHAGEFKLAETAAKCREMWGAKVLSERLL